MAIFAWRAVGLKKSSIVKRNLQRAYVAELVSQVVGAKSKRVPADAKSLAKFHLKEIKAKLAKTGKDDDETVEAFVLETRDQIDRVLAASVTTTE